MTDLSHSYLSRRDLHENVSRAVLPILQKHLTNTLDLFAQMKQAHWTVRGPSFIALHELFDRLAEEIEDASDEIAERMAALGGHPDGRVRATARDTALYEYPAAAVHGTDHLRALAGSLAIHAKGLRADIDATAALGDADSADLLTQLSRQTDKQLWFIEAHLDGAT
jgi:starvation-inducible DNA-binding protein